MVISVWASASKDYVSPPYEGLGTERLFRVDYGVGFQGTTTFFAICYNFYLSYTQLKKVPTERMVAVWTGVACMITVMTLQTAILFGNELMDVTEIDQHNGISQSCGQNDAGCYDPPGCTCEEGGYKIRTYSMNENISHSLESTVVFAVFLFLEHLVYMILLFVWKDELGQGMGNYIQTATAGDEYQKL